MAIPIEQRDKAQKALLVQIEKATQEVEGSTYLVDKVVYLQKLAYAFRLTVGGPQPGSVEVSSK